MDKIKVFLVLALLMIPFSFAFKGVIVSTEGVIIQADFTSLNDTPSSYAGANNNCVIVNETSNQLYFGSCAAAGSGDITAVIAGTGLSGGATSGDATLDIIATTCAGGEYSQFNGTGFECETDVSGGGSGGDFFFANFSSSFDSNFSSKTTDDLSEGSTNLYDNSSWAQSLADTLYADIMWGYNQSDGSDNSTWNQALATTLYAGIEWDYNQTTTTLPLTGITGLDHNACSAGNFVNNVTFDNGDILITCDAPAGSGDITAVFTNGDYLTGGGPSGDISLLLNETVLNATIDSRDSDTTYTAGAGLTLTGTEFNHTDTSSQASSDNSGRTYIQDILLDTYGHITSLVTATETVVDTDTDTNASTICSGTTTYLDGEGNCDDISTVYEVQLNNEAGLYSVLSDVTEFLETNDAGTLTTLDTGQGANELYDMNQNVLTTSNVEFSNITSTGNITTNDRICLNGDCTSYIWNNGTDSIWV